MTYDDAILLAKEDPDRYELTVHWEMGLMCPNPREEALKMGVYCIICSHALEMDGKCHTEGCPCCQEGE